MNIYGDSSFKTHLINPLISSGFVPTKSPIKYSIFSVNVIFSERLISASVPAVTVPESVPVMVTSAAAVSFEVLPDIASPVIVVTPFNSTSPPSFTVIFVKVTPGFETNLPLTVRPVIVLSSRLFVKVAPLPTVMVAAMLAEPVKSADATFTLMAAPVESVLLICIVPVPETVAPANVKAPFALTTPLAPLMVKVLLANASSPVTVTAPLSTVTFPPNVISPLIVAAPNVPPPIVRSVVVISALTDALLPRVRFAAEMVEPVIVALSPNVASPVIAAVLLIAALAPNVRFPPRVTAPAKAAPLPNVILVAETVLLKLTPVLSFADATIFPATATVSLNSTLLPKVKVPGVPATPTVTVPLISAPSAMAKEPVTIRFALTMAPASISNCSAVIVPLYVSPVLRTTLPEPLNVTSVPEPEPSTVRVLSLLTSIAPVSTASVAMVASPSTTTFAPVAEAVIAVAEIVLSPLMVRCLPALTVMPPVVTLPAMVLLVSTEIVPVAAVSKSPVIVKLLPPFNVSEPFIVPSPSATVNSKSPLVLSNIKLLNLKSVCPLKSPLSSSVPPSADLKSASWQSTPTLYVPV